MNETNHDAILKKVSTLFERMNQNRQLQELAENNGIDIKNSIKLTDDNMMNVAVTLVALSLAKEANDPRYKKLVNQGLQKRSLKLEIVNDYKSQANELIQSLNKPNIEYNESDVHLDVSEDKDKEDDEDDIQQEGFLSDVFTSPDKKCFNAIKQMTNGRLSESWFKEYESLAKKSHYKPFSVKFNDQNHGMQLINWPTMLFWLQSLMQEFNQTEVSLLPIGTIPDESHSMMLVDINTDKYYYNLSSPNINNVKPLFENFEEFKKCVMSNDMKRYK